jgi:hypothetical protein
MARYLANVEQKIDNEFIADTQVMVDLKTAKALAQVFVDKNRAEAHLKQKPVNWLRTHSDRAIRWFGFVDGNVEVVVESV